jgi:uncharacterized membrane protein YcaP (DUF421 family)
MVKKMAMFTTIFRTLFFYFFVTIGYRLMGKREIGELGVIDLIVSILIAELVAISIENYDRSIMLTIWPITILVSIEILFAYLSMKSRTFRNIMDGKTSIIINHGILNYKEMIRQRYSLDDLLLGLRQEGIKSIEEVEYAFLESNGKLSIFKYNLFKTDGNYPMPIIVDGVIQEVTLKNIHKTKLWLKTYLKRQNTDLTNVFYAFYKNHKVYLIKHSDIVSV